MSESPDNLPMGSWVREKIEHVLQEIARIADIAKDPQTPPWYKRNIRRSLGPAFWNGLKLLLWSYDRVDDWTPELSKRPTEHGTLGLAALLNQLGIEHRLAVGMPTVDPDDEDDREATTHDEPPSPSKDPWSEAARQWAVRLTLFRVADARIPANALRLLAWIAYHLASSEHADVAFLTRKFISSDIGLSDADGKEALDHLIECEFVHEVRALSDERTIALRLIVEGMNEPRNEPLTH